MTAKEAREITMKCDAKDLIERSMIYIYQQIEKAAKNGECTKTFCGFYRTTIGKKINAAVANKLQNDGYEIEYLEDVNDKPTFQVSW